MKTNIVLWTKTADQDLREIIEYIANDSVDNAIIQFEKIRTAAQKISHFPSQGRIIPELAKQNIHLYHELIITPWRLMYKLEGTTVYVLAVIDGRRNIEDILLNRQLR